ncbi:Protein NPR-20 [Aphelenchoides avenae]|nr:Protein NPR-20 [Aphelenchus avenae]
MAGIWLISLVVNLPYYFTTFELRFGQFAACARDMSGYGSISTRDMVTLSFAIWYCIPLLTIAFLYTRIGMVLWSTSLKPLEIRYSNGTTYSDNNGGNIYLTITNYDTSHNGNGVVADSNGTQKLLDEKRSIANSDVLESRKKVIRLLIAIVCSFATLTLPHHARLLYLNWTDDHMCNSTYAALLQPLSYLSLFVSSSVNPILYAYMSQRFREAVRDIMQCRSGKQMRKYTRTRTILSDMPEISRSPSLHRANHANLRTTRI